MKRSYKQFKKKSFDVKHPSWKVKASIAWWRKQPGCYRSTHLSPQVTIKHEKTGEVRQDGIFNRKFMRNSGANSGMKIIIPGKQLCP